MNLDEFENQYRSTLDDSLNQLQAAVLLLAQLEARITNVGQGLRNLSEILEEYVTQQRSE